MRRIFVVAAGLAAFVAAGSARASSYDFSYTAAGGPSGVEFGSGEITLSNTETNGAFQVTAISGQANLSEITGLSPYAAADNEVFASPPPVDLGGISFATASGIDYNFYSYNNGFYVLSSAVDSIGYPANGSPVTSLTFTPTSAVPEPATWLLMIAGIGGIGLILRRAKKEYGFKWKELLLAD